MTKNIFLLFFVLSIAACRSNQDEAFKLFYADFQEQVEAEPMFRAFLEKRLSFDSLLVQPKTEDLERVLTQSKEQLKSLHLFELDRLDHSLHEHYQNAHSFFTIIIKHIEVDKIHINQPNFYSPLPYLTALSQNADQARLIEGLDAVNFNYELAIETLKNGDSKGLKDAIQNGIQVFELLSNEIRNRIKTVSPDKEEKKILFLKLTRARLAVKDYMSYCQSLIFEQQNQSMD